MVVIGIISGKKLCQEAIQEFLCFIYAPQYEYTDSLKGMTFVICS
jgi:hypothetical protein